MALPAVNVTGLPELTDVPAGGAEMLALVGAVLIQYWSTAIPQIVVDPLPEQLLEAVPTAFKAGMEV